MMMEIMEINVTKFCSFLWIFINIQNESRQKIIIKKMMVEKVLSHCCLDIHFRGTRLSSLDHYRFVTCEFTCIPCGFVLVTCEFTIGRFPENVFIACEPEWCSYDGCDEYGACEPILGLWPHCPLAPDGWFVDCEKETEPSGFTLVTCEFTMGCLCGRLKPIKFMRWPNAFSVFCVYWPAFDFNLDRKDGRSSGDWGLAIVYAYNERIRS